MIVAVSKAGLRDFAFLEFGEMVDDLEDRRRARSLLRLDSRVLQPKLVIELLDLLYERRVIAVLAKVLLMKAIHLLHLLLALIPELLEALLLDELRRTEVEFMR